MVGDLLHLVKRKLARPGVMEHASSDLHDSWASRHLVVAKHFRSTLNGSVLVDYGCWDGSMLRCCQALGIACSYYGLDIDEGILETAERCNYGFVSFQVLNTDGTIPDDLPAPDVLLLLDVIEHLPAGTELQCLSHLRQRLRKGGALIVSCPHRSLWSFMDPAWPLGHRHYTTQRLSRLMVDAGFRAEEIFYQGTFFDQLDTVLFYIHKHLLRKQYRTSGWLKRRIDEGLSRSSGSAHMFILSRKVV